MSASSILGALLIANVAASAAIVFVLLVRSKARKLVGARIAYWLWIIPLFAGLAVLLPARTMLVTLSSLPDPLGGKHDLHVEANHIAPPVDIAFWLVAVWTIVAVALFALLILRHVRALRRGVSDFGPAVVGIIRPKLVLPADFEVRFSARERELIVAHENAHLGSGDTRINAGLALIGCMNWFNPLVHLAIRLARLDQELARDATVIERYPGDRRTYAEALLKAQAPAVALPFVCAWPAKSSNILQERMMMLAIASPGRRQRMLGAGMVVSVALSAGLVAWASKPLEIIVARPPLLEAAATTHSPADSGGAPSNLGLDRASHPRTQDHLHTRSIPQQVQQALPPPPQIPKPTAPPSLSDQQSGRRSNLGDKDSPALLPEDQTAKFRLIVTSNDAVAHRPDGSDQNWGAITLTVAAEAIARIRADRIRSTADGKTTTFSGNVIVDVDGVANFAAEEVRVEKLSSP